MLPTIKDATDRPRFLNKQRRSMHGIDRLRSDSVVEDIA